MQILKLDQYAQRLDLPIEQGATFNLEFSRTDANGAAVDLTGHTLRMQMRDPTTDELIANGALVILESGDNNSNP